MGALLLLAIAVLVVWLTTGKATQVTMNQAESRLGPTGGAPGADRPAPGVYRYAGSGTETLSLPPLSQSEGPTMPGSVTLQGANCWIFRLDYSTHHWQTWRYCRHDGNLWEAGGQTWQVWSVGPLDVTNLTSFTCVGGSMALPAAGSPGQQWHSRRYGSNSSIKGHTVTSGPYRLLGYTTVPIGGVKVRAAHFLRRREDSGAQRGTEKAQVWVDARTGLPLRLRQDLTIRTSTPFGSSTYTQVGELSLVSLTAHR